MYVVFYVILIFLQVYTRNNNPDESTQRYKARHVAKGTRVSAVDYLETFSPVL